MPLHNVNQDNKHLASLKKTKYSMTAVNVRPMLNDDTYHDIIVLLQRFVMCIVS